MRPERLMVLIRKELRGGSSNFMVIFALLMPIVMTVVVTLLFNTLFSETVALGVVSMDESQFAQNVETLEFVDVRRYDDVGSLRNAVGDGAVSMGLIVPEGVDSAIDNSESVELNLLIWGQSLAQDRLVLVAGLNTLVSQQSGVEAVIEVNTVNLGDDDVIPLEDRLLPLLVLVAVIIGGTLVPAGSMVEERQKHTLGALTTTPATLGEVLLAKGILGTGLSLFTGVFILVLNNAFGTEPLIMIVTLALGAMFSSAFGIVLGLFLKDMNTLFATMKVLGILLYAPAFIYLFPDVPQVIAQVFPTYYIIAPIVEVSQNGAGWSEVLLHLGVLTLLIGVMIAGIIAIINNPARREALA